MYIALFIIMAIFTITTKGVFISSRNIANLMNQTGYIAVLAVGMTLVIVIRHIDLSVGFLAGFLGAIAAIAMVSWGWPVCVVHPLRPGARRPRRPHHGLPGRQAGHARLRGDPGRLAHLPRRPAPRHPEDGHHHHPGHDFFNAIGNGYIPDICPAESRFLPGVHKLTLLLGLLAIVWFISQRVQEPAQQAGLQLRGDARGLLRPQARLHLGHPGR